MFAIIGALVVFASVVGGYLMAHGHLMVLFQPAEYIIIGGAAIGGLITGAPLSVLKDMIPQILKILSSGPNKQSYQDLLVMLYELFNVARKDGLVGLEAHIENPEESSIIQKYPNFVKNHHALHFLADTMRLIIMGGIPDHDLDAMMDLDLEIHHEETSGVSTALSSVADALPGLGIVAAVLGIVITMGAIGGPAEEVGHHVAAALIGTFFGILLSYGFAAPLASCIRNMNEAEGKYIVCLKQGLLGFHKGFASSISVELARRTIPSELRPGFTEIEDACRNSKTA